MSISEIQERHDETQINPDGSFRIPARYSFDGEQAHKDRGELLDLLEAAEQRHKTLLVCAMDDQAKLAKIVELPVQRNAWTNEMYVSHSKLQSIITGDTK